MAPQMNKNIFVHADDFGASVGINDSILALVDQGAINSLSVLANGQGFSHGVQELLKRPRCRIAAHLNLVEGKAITGVSLITNQDGFFSTSFLKLAMIYYSSSKRKRQALLTAITVEWEAQIIKLKEALQEDQVLSALDSHQHLHLLPFVFDIVLSLAKRNHIPFVRTIREPYFFPTIFFHIPAFASIANHAKFFILNFLSIVARARALNAGIRTNDYFLGVLATGYMNSASIAQTLRKLAPSMAPGEIIEILFHPGQAKSGEEEIWSKEKKFKKFYFSKCRKLESTQALSFQRMNLLDCIK